VDGRTAQVNFPCSLIKLPLPPFPVFQVDLEMDMPVVYGERLFLTSQILQEHVVHGIYVICGDIPAF